MGIYIFIVIALYIVYAYSLQLICCRIGVKSAWLSWTPLSPILIYKAGDQAWWWFIILLIPFVNFIAVIILFVAWLKIFQKLNWKLVIIPLISFLLIICSTFFLVTTFLTSSEPYKMSVIEIKKDPDLIQELGSPIKIGMVQGEINYSFNKGIACLFLPLSGSKGKGLAVVEGIEIDRVWKIYRLTVKVENTNTLWFIKAPIKNEDQEPCPNNGVPKVNSNYFLQKGIAFDEQQNYQEAFNYYSIGMKLDPNNTELYTNRGGLLLDLGEYKAALVDLNRAIELDPNNSRAYNNRGNTQVVLGNKKLGIADLSKAIEIDPSYAKAYYNRAIHLVDIGNDKQALSDFNQAIKLNNDYLEAYLMRGNLYQKLGNKNAAIQDYDKLYSLAKRLNNNELQKIAQEQLLKIQ